MWREQADPEKAGRTKISVWRKGVACHLEPISAIDHTVAFALESTHVFYLSPWFIGLRKLDEIRLGGRITADGTRQPTRYIVNGVQRRLTFGLQSILAFCSERD